MRDAIVIGSGISGMVTAIKLAEAGVHVLLASPFPSERSQSVMAAGGINAVMTGHEEGDSVASHIEDTLKGGSYLAGKEAVTGLCESAEEIIEYLEGIGVVFSVDEDGRPDRRAIGGHSYRRTCFCGSSTGKQIVSALVMETRRLEATGLIKRALGKCFHSALIRDGVCYGALFFDEAFGTISAEYADAVVVATGGQNALFGKTTGSTQCDGYTAGRLFVQGVELKNLEFVQFHPTTIETSQKRMLVSEAARGEGGRLFYTENGERVYFMEEKYGPKGNLMPRDIVSREICSAGRDVFLDVSFLKDSEIDSRLSEVRELCKKYIGIDITKEPIPVAPSVHFFMGGIAVHNNHETNIRDLFAVGECASIYHGANRLGGNSLLAAVYSGMASAREIIGRYPKEERPDFTSAESEANRMLDKMRDTKSVFPVMYIRDMAAETMNRCMGIVRSAESIKEGIADIDYYLSVAERLSYDNSVLPYFNYSLTGILTLARAALSCAEARKESRGAHYRSDYPDTRDDHAAATIISYENGQYKVRFDRENEYES